MLLADVDLGVVLPRHRDDITILHLPRADGLSIHFEDKRVFSSVSHNSGLATITICRHIRVARAVQRPSHGHTALQHAQDQKTRADE